MSNSGITVEDLIKNGSNPPIVIFLSGVPGTGKSTIAIELAKRLGITQVISSDNIRETIRFIAPRTTSEFLRVSSFEAWKLLGEWSQENVIQGWSNSRDALTPSLEYLIRNEFSRGRDAILEGNLVPRPSDLELTSNRCLSILLVLHNSQMRRQRLQYKMLTSRGAGPERWFESFGDAEIVQQHLIEQAERSGTYVIDNVEIATTVDQICSITLASH